MEVLPQKLQKQLMSNFPFSKRDIFFVVISALAIVLSFPNIEWSGLIWISLIPFFFILEKKSAKHAFWLGFTIGTLISLGAFYWVLYTLQEFGQLPFIAAAPLFLIFCTFCNIHIAFFAYLLRRFPLPISPTFFVPLLYVIIEFLTPQIFHWYLGSCLYKKIWLIQFADITGVHGVTFLVVLVNSCIYELIRWIKKETDHFPKYPLILTLTLLIFSGFYSALKLRDYEDMKKRAPVIHAALVQTNIGNLEKLSAARGYTEAVETSKAVMERLVLKASKTKNLDLIILPETAVPGYFTQDRPVIREFMFHLASMANVPIYFGGYNKKEEANELKTYNSTFLISNFFQVLGSYDKIKLLIFGEYFPIKFIQDLIPAMGNFSFGTKMEPLSLTKDFKLIPLICFEAIFPDFVRQFVKKGGNCLITVTNDSWFGKTASPYQHLMLQVWRSVENKIPMLRSANTGISAFIDATGRIQSKTPIFIEDTLIDEVPILGIRTFYTQYGNIFLYLCFFILGILYSINFFLNRCEP